MLDLVGFKSQSISVMCVPCVDRGYVSDVLSEGPPQLEGIWVADNAVPRLSYFESADYKKSETAYNQAR